jgi:outer membrane protein assembly factor BamB
VWKITYTGAVPYIPGQPYTAGALPKRQAATGVLTAVDVSTGRAAWTKQLPYSAQGGVLVTTNGLIFTSDVSGRLYAFDAKTGNELWHDDTGSAIVAPISAYSIDGNEYLVVEAGEAGNQQTPNLPKSAGARVVAYALGVTQTATNDVAGQPAVSAAGASNRESGSGAPAAATGSVPYTTAQVRSGAAVYAKECLSCHGTKLQGVSGPALAGPQFAHANLDVGQIYAIVSQQMPLTAPASLSKSDYAAVMAYILAYGCVKSTGDGKLFPSTPTGQVATVKTGAAVCPNAAP